MAFYITKISGEKELFDPEKLKRSLRKSKAPESLIDEILQKVENDPSLRTTQSIYGFAYDCLRQSKPSLAARYSLKQALIELGPAGFPFEQFIAHLFRKEGYFVETNQIVVGHCVEHEVDVICSNNKQKFMVECKFHGRPELKCDVKVSLYVKARFDDIKEAHVKSAALRQAHNNQEVDGHSHAALRQTQNERDVDEFHEAWIVTNTKFTTEAIKFATCRNIQLIGWSIPEGRSLSELVAKYGAHPITALTSLSGSQKRMLIQNNIVLCQDVEKHKNMFKELGFSHDEIENLVNEAHEVCTI